MYEDINGGFYMSVKLETIEENKRKLTVTVAAESFNKALDFAFKKLSKDVEIKGFRKGKVPRAIFEQRFGEASLYEEAINYLLPGEVPKALKEAGVTAVAQPEVDVDYETIGKDKDLTLYLTVVVEPKVELGQYKGLEVNVLSTEVTEEDVDNELNKLIERYAELVVKDSEAVEGDTVVIDFEGFQDDVAFEGGKGENHSLKLGSNSFIPGFEDQLIGIKAGEDRDVNVTFPEAYQAEDLAGKDAVFKVHCHEVKVRTLPELTDEFVKELEDVENIDSVEALRNDAREKLQKQKEEASKNHTIDTVVELASQQATMNIPEEMIEAQTDRLMENAEQQLSQQGITLDLYFQFTGGTVEGFREQLKNDAIKQIRSNLTLEAIADAEGFNVSEEEIDAEMEQIAQAYNVSFEQVKAVYSADQSEIIKSLKVRKAIDLLVDEASKVTNA